MLNLKYLNEMITYIYFYYIYSLNIIIFGNLTIKYFLAKKNSRLIFTAKIISHSLKMYINVI